MTAAEKPIRHKLLFDEAEAMLAARFAGFLLEPSEAARPARPWTSTRIAR